MKNNLSKYLVAIFIICSLLFSVNVICAQTEQNKDNKPEETRYVVSVVPIYAICNYNNHKKIYGTVSFSGVIVSTGGRVVYSGNTPLYVYSYTDEYNNYYEPYFSGYTYFDEDYTYVSGCPLND